MEFLLGKPVAEIIKNRVKEKIVTLKRSPRYVVLLNKEDESSLGYARSQERLAREVGIEFSIIEVEPSEEAYISLIDKVNNDDTIDGVLITRPLFKGANEKKILSCLDYRKDVDAINPYSLGKMFMDDAFLVPATAEAVIEMLKYYNIDLVGKKVLVVGRSLSVGKSAAMLLLKENATVTIAHSKSKNFEKEYEDSDIVVAAVGKKELLYSSEMNENCVVIDCGIHYTDEGIFGDVKVSDKVKYISKVPGGIGPITSALLMEHVLKCYMEKNND